LNTRDMSIGFFDSGLGGISVLKKAIQLMPDEDYIYFGDSANAPYGEKSKEDIVNLTLNSVKILIEKDIKAIVIACNTATAYAIDQIRSLYSDKLLIIGIEPAIKPAVFLKSHHILLLATNATLNQENLKEKIDHYKICSEIIPIGAPKLVEFIEAGVYNGNDVENYIKDILKDYLHMSNLTVVLGCTHFPFFKSSLKKILHKDAILLDGSDGTSKRLKDQLLKCSLRKDSSENGKITFLNSLKNDKIISRCFELLELDI